MWIVAEPTGHGGRDAGGGALVIDQAVAQLPLTRATAEKSATNGDFSRVGARRQIEFDPSKRESPAIPPLASTEGVENGSAPGSRAAFRDHG